MFANMLEPPYERNGNGTPVIGINPRVMPIFSNVWKANQATTPIATKRPNGSVVLLAILKPRIMIVINKIKIKLLPTKPVSSPATVKIFKANIFRKFQIEADAELIKIALEYQLLEI